jgi:hypothetical protein
MKQTLSVIIAALACAAIAAAQTAQQAAETPQPNEFAAALASYQAAASPAFTGAGLYAKQLAPEAAPKTYSLTEYDVTPRSWKPFVLNSVMRTGLYQELLTYGNLRAGVCADIGGGTAGANAVGSFSGCGMAFYRIGKTKWYAAVVVSGIKTSLSDATTVYKIGIRRDR